MTADELKKRTLQFGVDVALFCKIIYSDSLLKAYAEKSIDPIWKEANEILSIIITSIATARKSQSKKS